MKWKFFILILLYSASCFGRVDITQEAQCKEVLTYKSNSINSLPYSKVDLIVSSVEESCYEDESQEFSDTIGVIVYKVLTIAPYKFMKSFETQYAETQDTIIMELSSPFDRSIDFKKAFQAIENTKYSADVKNKILDAIRKGAKKLDVKL